MKNHWFKIVIGAAIVLIVGSLGFAIYTYGQDYQAPVNKSLRAGVEWEALGRGVHRTKVPEGWLISKYGNAVTYVPDPEHEWLREE